MLQTVHFDRFDGSVDVLGRFWLSRAFRVLLSVSSRRVSSEAGEWGLEFSEGVVGSCMVG